MASHLRTQDGLPIGDEQMTQGLAMTAFQKSGSSECRGEVGAGTMNCSGLEGGVLK